MQSQETVNPVADKPPEDQVLYPHGWRLCFITIGLLISLYLVNLEVTIVSTSLLSITSDLDGFNKTSWIVTGFLVTYTGWISLPWLPDLSGPAKLRTGFMSIWTRVISHHRGSTGHILCAYEIVPKSKLPIWGGMIGMAIACASLTGPLIGGVLALNSSWRWVFYVNLPPGAVAVTMLFMAMPAGFGSVAPKPITHLRPTLSLFRALDVMGSVLLLSGSFLLVAVLNETNLEFEWASGTAIGLLVVSGLSWMAFFIWEWLIDGRPGYQPIFPRRFIFNRAWMGMLITVFVSGCPWNVVIVYLSQRFQVLGGSSPLGAGVRLIPYSALATLSTSIACIACLRGRIPFVYFILFGSLLHVVGMALFITLPQTNSFPSAGYGYEVLAGTGVGTTIGICILAVPYVVERRDLATATGALNQCRFLGGAIGLAIASNIQYGNLKHDLADTLSPDQLRRLLEDASIVKTFPAQVQAVIQRVFAKSYTHQYQAMIAFAAVQIPASLLIFRRGAQYVATEEEPTDSDRGSEITA